MTVTTKPTTPCRIWQGPDNGNGYGTRWSGGKRVYVHRWVMAQIHGWGALKGKVVMHRCDRPGCFRYDHLQIGTYADNNRDAAEKGHNHNSLKTHCPKGHAYTPENTLTFASEGRRRCRKCRNAAVRDA